MKIVHVIATIDPSAGGPASVVVRLAAAQAALGHEVHVLSYGDRASEERARKSAELVPHLADVHLHRVDGPGLPEKLVAATGGRAFKRLVLASALLDVLRSPDTATRMGEQAKKLVRSRYAWQGIALRSIQAYALVYQLADVCERIQPF